MKKEMKEGKSGAVRIISCEVYPFDVKVWKIEGGSTVQRPKQEETYSPEGSDGLPF